MKKLRRMTAYAVWLVYMLLYQLWLVYLHSVAFLSTGATVRLSGLCGWHMRRSWAIRFRFNQLWAQVAGLLCVLYAVLASKEVDKWRSWQWTVIVSWQ